jgi:hypothetical protein
MCKSFIAHTISREKAHGTQSLVEHRVIEHIGPRKEIHPSICQLKADAQRVIKTILMIRYYYGRRAVHRHILQSDHMFLLEIQAGVDKLEICTECLY